MEKAVSNEVKNGPLCAQKGAKRVQNKWPKSLQSGTQAL